jgi:hypothetical protein
MTARVWLGKCNRTSGDRRLGSTKYGCQPMPIGSRSVADVLRRDCHLEGVVAQGGLHLTSVSESQWP